MSVHSRRSWPIVAVLTLAGGSTAVAQDKGAVEFVGRVEATATVELRARVAGQVTQVPVKVGDAVKQGQVLFQIDPRPFQLEVDRAQAGVAQAEARIKLYTAELARARSLRMTGGVTQGEFDRLEAERVGAIAGLDSARAGLELAKLYLDFTKVVAPMNGRVVRALAPGSVVRENRTAIGTLVADDPIAVAFGVDEKTTLRLLKSGRTGGKAAVGFADEDGFPHEGQVNSVEPRADPKTGVVQWRLVLPNPDRRVVPGMSARVRLPG